MGALDLRAQKYGGSHFRRSQATKSVGALALSTKTVLLILRVFLKKMFALSLELHEKLSK